MPSEKVIVRVLAPSYTPNDPFSESQSTPKTHQALPDPLKSTEVARRWYDDIFDLFENDVH